MELSKDYIEEMLEDAKMQKYIYMTALKNCDIFGPQNEAIVIYLAEKITECGHLISYYEKDLRSIRDEM